MKRQITISWDGDDTKVTFSDGWKGLYDMAKLDNLQDAILELTAKYDAELKQFFDREKPEEA